MTQAKVRASEFLPTFSEILTQAGVDRMTARASETFTQPQQAAREAQRQWTGAIAALVRLLDLVACHRSPNQAVGLILSGPSAAMSQFSRMQHFATWQFTPPRAKPIAQLPGAISADFTGLDLPEGCTQTPENSTDGDAATTSCGTIPLLRGDPLAAESFCLVLTPQFSVAMVRGWDETRTPTFQFSFEPDVVERAWMALRGRVCLSHPHQVRPLDRLFDRFPPTVPYYKTVMRFTQLLLQYLPEGSSEETPRQLPKHRLSHGTETRTSESKESQCHGKREKAAPSSAQCPKTASENPHADLELLQAIFHEVRTPLSTIRTLTRLLMKRKDLSPEVMKWVDTIDRECSEQIDRMELIFKAVELETSPVKRSPVHLTSTCLAEVVKSCIPRWQKQACRRGLKLNVSLPQTMPQVVSDPTMLDRVLTGAIENFTNGIPAGSQVTVQMMLAGSQLKLQLKCQSLKSGFTNNPSTLKSIGQLLMFQPETGNLSLNLSVTKNLFQALGGKLIVRTRPHKGEELTIFLPLK